MITPPHRAFLGAVLGFATIFQPLTGMEILRQDFEDTSLFQSGGEQLKQVGLSKNIGGNWLGFNGGDFTIVRENAPGPGAQALKISRIQPAMTLSAFRTVELPDDREYTVRMMLKPGATDKCRFGFLLRNSFANQDVAKLQFSDDNILLSVVDGRGHFVLRSLPDEWAEYSFTIIPGSTELAATRLSPDGSISHGVATPLIKSMPVNQIVFFNMPGSSEPALVDNLSISVADSASVKGRENVALSVSEATATISDARGTRPAPRVNDGDTDSTLSEVVSGLPAEILISLPDARTVSSVRLYSGKAEQLNYPSGDLSVTEYKIEGFSTASGQWRELSRIVNAPTAQNAAEDDSGRFSQADFPPIEIKQLKLTILNNNDTGRRYSGSATTPEALIREVELFDHNRGGAAAGLGKVLQAEFRLPVYRDQQQAQLHAILDESIPELEIELDFRNRLDNFVPAPARRVTIKSGENVIPIDISDWPNGEFRTRIRAAGSQSAARGELARLLRIDRIPETAPAAGADWSGKRLFFPDKKFFTRSNNVKIEVFPPEIHTLNHNFLSDNNAYVQLGGPLGFLPSGELAMKFTEYDREWKNPRPHYAITTPGEWQWRISDEMPEGFAEQNCELSQQICRNVGGSIPGWSVGDNRNFRLYDPETDGPVELKNLLVQYTGYKPADWGVVKAPPQTTWLVWKKSPNDFVLLSDKPFLIDGVSSDEFEDPQNTNDNFAGQWLSDDGKTLFYVRGRLLKRYPPFIARYDNLWMVSRILTVFSTSDGLNWERHYYALPDESDAPTMQHYGSSIYRVPRGNGLMIGFQMNYSALHQQYDVELVYSRDGRKWQRFPGHRHWIECSEPDGWNFGTINLHNNIVERDGVTYHEIGWAQTLPHFAYEINTNQLAGKLTGAELEKRYSSREITSWPYWNHYGSYDRLAEAWRNAGSTCGISVYRRNGWFGISAGAAEGTFTTLPLRAKGRLAANFRTGDDGFIEIQLLGTQGMILNTHVLHGDAIEEPVFDSLPDGEFQIQVKMKNAILHSLDFN